jgi:hypothetical protein
MFSSAGLLTWAGEYIEFESSRQREAPAGFGGPT